MELWAGFECTRNRVRDTFRDQLARGDRTMRVQCLRALPDLGVKAFRFRIAWDDDETPGEWIDDDMALLARGGVDPILGLLHHGSGPVGTNLLSSTFASGLAQHAARVAARFPEAKMWTPVNEPLTTARFSALYGHWYPHARSEKSFWLALLNQIDATRLAMREIRRINPDAKLLQTEDLGRTFGTALLTDQIAFDNQRRWMTWDLLVGRVVPGHPFFSRLRHYGFEDRLRMIADDPCPPDIVGIDHYLTSDRFLDHRLARYPAQSRGGNGHNAYADVEAVRVLSTPPDSITAALSEAWYRYRLPVALTECHNGCTREEQMRWLREAWDTAEGLQASGCDVRAVTAWALLGARDWSSLATEERGDFECGAFDPRGGWARPTGLVGTMASLGNDRPVAPPAQGDGWWRRENRLRYRSAAFAAPVTRRPSRGQGAPLLVAGATGTLGQAFVKAARARGLPVIATTREAMALDKLDSVEAAIERYQPWAVINATGWVRVDDAESDPTACARSNVEGALILADACERRGLRNLHFSSDLVFDGSSTNPYHEGDPVSPVGVYAHTKAEADGQLLQLSTTLVIRTAAFFSPFDQHNFAVAAINSLRAATAIHASAHHRVSPTYVPHLVDLALDLLIDDARGLWHVSNGEEVSWRDFAVRLATACALDADMVMEAEPKQLGWIAARPARSGLVSRKGGVLPTLQQGIYEFAHHI